VKEYLVFYNAGPPEKNTMSGSKVLTFSKKISMVDAGMLQLKSPRGPASPYH